MVFHPCLMCVRQPSMPNNLFLRGIVRLHEGD